MVSFDITLFVSFIAIIIAILGYWDNRKNINVVSCQAYNVVKFIYYILHTQSEGIEFEEIQSYTYQR